MNEFLWAIGSMLIVMAIVYFLPLGLTKKGKVILVMISFLLALGGIAATASFSLLLSVLILVVLVFFVTYLLEQRLGKWLYINNDYTSIGEEEHTDLFMNTEQETAASFENVYQRKEEAILEPLHHIKEDIETNDDFESKQMSGADIPEFDTPDEDISFLLNRSISLEKETSNLPTEQKADETDYLAEIESMLIDQDGLADVYRPNTSPSTASMADEDLEIPVLSFEDKPVKKKSDSPVKKMEDFDEIPVLPFHEMEGESKR
jgi:hypothetical protein